ncbi:MAG: hypothetical protein ABI423_05435 [Burkholderiales bacterium]
MVPNILLHGFLDDNRQVSLTYWLAALQLALLVIAYCLATFTASDLSLIFLLVASACLMFQALFLWRIVTHKLGDRIDAAVPPVGHAAMFHERSPVSTLGWLHATGGCLASILGSAVLYFLYWI